MTHLGEKKLVDRKIRDQDFLAKSLRGHVFSLMLKEEVSFFETCSIKSSSFVLACLECCGLGSEAHQTVTPAVSNDSQGLILRIRMSIFIAFKDK